MFLGLKMIFICCYTEIANREWKEHKTTDANFGALQQRKMKFLYTDTKALDVPVVWLDKFFEISVDGR
jgi:hypothetical protein